jgi:hypothetical protein
LLRIALTTKSAREIHAMVEAFNGILERYSETEMEVTVLDTLPLPVRVVSEFKWVICWDGSFNG